MVNTRIEQIMMTRMESSNGWAKLNGSKRHMRIGYTMNCNGDGLCSDPRNKQQIKTILDRYNIEYELIDVHTSFEFSVEIRLIEEQYQLLKHQMIGNVERTSPTSIHASVRYI